MYIQALGNISPQTDFNQLQQKVDYTSNHLKAADADITEFVNPNIARRMGRIIKMGVAAAMACMKEAGLDKPDAITMGTAYGCLEDTGVFLKKLVEQNETMLTPTNFIQSTHNTVSGQIALLLKTHCYNNTFVHRGFSFESALQDAIMLMNENDAAHVLVGAADEITDASHKILSRFDLYKKDLANSEELFTQHTKGTIAGEGSVFFMMNKNASEKDYALLKDVTTFYKPIGNHAITDRINKFLSLNGLSINDIDVVINGKNGDEQNDRVYEQLEENILSGKTSITYKQWCGEFPTSSAYALWLAANIAKHQQLPADKTNRSIKHILVYNHYQNIHHSLQLVTAC
ncbi:beta-ketoacyl synthase chain length factor [Chitinophagaceae bacterium 26-R-25]|nr:beta-ketoacyl synthase chain length factor [Chitinophagaceae bacterium 26-R-25]